MLKLPSKFLQQHGSKIRDGLIVLKLVSPDPDPDPDPDPNPNPYPTPTQVCDYTDIPSPRHARPWAAVQARGCLP